MLPYFPSTGLVLGQVLPTPGGANIPTAQADALLLATPVQGILSQELPLKALGCTSHWLELLRLHSGSSLEPQAQHQPHAVWVSKGKLGCHASVALVIPMHCPPGGPWGDSGDLGEGRGVGLCNPWHIWRGGGTWQGPPFRVRGGWVGRRPPPLH